MIGGVGLDLQGAGFTSFDVDVDVTPERPARPFLNLVTDLMPLDICLEPAGTSGYGEFAAHVVNISIGTTTVPVAAVEDIARSKEAARRLKDLRVLPRIRAPSAARDRCR